MFKIIIIASSLLINSCALTEQSVDRKILVKKQKNIAPKSELVYKKPEDRKKLTDSKNKEDDSLFEFIKIKIDNAIDYISKGK